MSPNIEGAGLGTSLTCAGAPDNGTSEVQRVTLTGSPGGGTFKLAYEGFFTADIAYNAAAATVQTALRALSSIGSAGCTVSGSAGGPWDVTFAGNLAKLNVALISLYENALTGGSSPSATIAATTPGVTATQRGAAAGARLIDTTNKVEYINQGTALEPTWVATTAITAGELGAGALTADAAGRAVFAADFFDAATLTAKVANDAYTEAVLLAKILSGAMTSAFLTDAIPDDAITAAIANDIIQNGAIGSALLTNPHAYDAGAPMRQVLVATGNVVEAETVTVGADVYEFEVVNTDSTDDTQGGDFNNVTDPLVIADFGTNYPTLHALPLAAGRLIRIENEILEVDAIVGVGYTFNRGVSGTTTATHANGQNVYRGDDVAAGIAVGVVATLTPTVWTAALAADINNRGTANVVATNPSVNEVLIRSAATPGGTVAASASAFTTTETMTNAAFGAATAVSGKAAGVRKLSAINHTVTDDEVTAGAVRLCFPFTVSGFVGGVYDSNGLFKEDLTDQVVIATTFITWDGTGGTNPATGDVIRILAWD